VAQVIVTPQARRDVDEAIWSWMILLYRYEQSSDRVYVVAMHDGRSATSATATRSTYST
jgi:hypothetical protein